MDLFRYPRCKILYTRTNVKYTRDVYAVRSKLFEIDSTTIIVRERISSLVKNYINYI